MLLIEKVEIDTWIRQKCQDLSLEPPERLIVVSIPEQRLTLLENGKSPWSTSISTSLKPPSCQENSFGTPTGLHAVAAKIGDNAVIGTVFKGRVAVGHLNDTSEAEQKANLITTRILRLQGLEKGVNHGKGVDSFDRYIYIHGTNHEERIGQPFSGGCIEMRNTEIIELYERVTPGCWVYISATPIVTLSN